MFNWKALNRPMNFHDFSSPFFLLLLIQVLSSDIIFPSKLKLNFNVIVEADTGKICTFLQVDFRLKLY